MFNKFVNYLKEVRVEMKKVNWPSREATIRFTIIVIAVSLGVSAVLGVFDFVFAAVISSFIQ
ncbi:preprotein translocase subunit SecE [Candidatus Giovannonibacteria bacterium]|nr:preprotein translocase subunit SecE [Candidatus Giovannonibacteria bacterium]